MKANMVTDTKNKTAMNKLELKYSSHFIVNILSLGIPNFLRIVLLLINLYS